MNTKFLYMFAALAVALFSAGCVRTSTVRSATGEEHDDSYMLGMVQRYTKDTTIGQKDCEKAMTTIHPGEQPMVRKDYYASCFSVGMMDVDQQNQLPPPLPVDLNGDGKPDAMQYLSGLRVPMGLYLSQPGIYWPQEYTRRNLYHGNESRSPGYENSSVYQPYAPHTSGHHNGLRARGTLVGYPGDIATARTPVELATKRDLEGVDGRIQEDLNALYKQTGGEPEPVAPKGKPNGAPKK